MEEQARIVPVQNTLADNLPTYGTASQGLPLDVPADFKPEGKFVGKHFEPIDPDNMPPPPINPHYLPVNERRSVENKGLPFVDFLALYNPGQLDEYQGKFRFQLESTSGTEDQVRHYLRKGWRIIWYGNLMPTEIKGITNPEMVEQHQLIKQVCDFHLGLAQDEAKKVKAARSETRKAEERAEAAERELQELRESLKKKGKKVNE